MSRERVIDYPRQSVLSPQKREILERVAIGQTNAEIARAFGNALATVVSHLRGENNSIQHRLGARRQGQAILKAFEMGELDLITIVEKCNFDFDRYKKLMPREIQVLDKLTNPSRRMGNKDIADVMHIGRDAVRLSLYSIGKKLGVSKREEMIVFHLAATTYPFEKSVRYNGVVEESGF
ncbi:hypothetical protein HY439_01285 [Candidatus Microgenomates bacterium]|nr:hypothetical protein [Candidatus Microgenomates bacterium]